MNNPPALRSVPHLCYAMRFRGPVPPFFVRLEGEEELQIEWRLLCILVLVTPSLHCKREGLPVCVCLSAGMNAHISHLASLCHLWVMLLGSFVVRECLSILQPHSAVALQDACYL